MRILFTGGGSGGHITPIVAILRELKTIAEEEQILDLELFYMGPEDFTIDMLKDEEVKIVPIATGKLRNYFSWQNFTDPPKIALGVAQALWNVFLIMPDVVFSKGGYGAIPAIIASALFRLPLVIHESDAVPGRANLFSARFAKRIGISFAVAAEYFPKEKVALVGVPVRKRIFGGNKKEAKDGLGIFSEAPVIGVMGGSRGSQKVNEALVGILKELAAEYEIVHQTGTKNLADIKSETSVVLESAGKERYHPFGFLDEGRVRDFFAASDLIISRASATAIFEIAAWAKPAILIPLGTSAQDHQRKNAYEYASNGAAVVIEEANLSPHILLSEIKKVLGNPEQMKKMAASAQRFARIDSGGIIAREILKLGIH